LRSVVLAPFVYRALYTTNMNTFHSRDKYTKHHHIAATLMLNSHPTRPDPTKQFWSRLVGSGGVAGSSAASINKHKISDYTFVARNNQLTVRPTHKFTPVN